MYSERNQRVARQIAEKYLEKFPREVSYRYDIDVYEDGTFSFYGKFSDATIEKLKGYVIEAEDEMMDIDEVMRQHGDGDLADDLMSDCWPLSPKCIKAFDFDDTVKVAVFGCRELQDDGTLGENRCCLAALTDAEYAEILAEHLLCTNELSLNMLMYRKPELASKIMRYMVIDNPLDWENPRPLIGLMPEFKDVAEKIMNPRKDILGIFKSEDNDIRGFATRFKIRKNHKK